MKLLAIAVALGLVGECVRYALSPGPGGRVLPIGVVFITLTFVAALLLLGANMLNPEIVRRCNRRCARRWRRRRLPRPA